MSLNLVSSKTFVSTDWHSNKAHIMHHNRRPARAVSFWLPQYSCLWTNNLERSSCRHSNSTDITREQFKRSLKSWLFECSYGRRRVWRSEKRSSLKARLRNGLTYLLTMCNYNTNQLHAHRQHAEQWSSHHAVKFRPDTPVDIWLDFKNWIRYIPTKNQVNISD